MVDVEGITVRVLDDAGGDLGCFDRTCQSGNPNATTTKPRAPLVARTALDVTGIGDYNVTMLVLFSN